jgi:hypothetical protein
MKPDFPQCGQVRCGIRPRVYARFVNDRSWATKGINVTFRVVQPWGPNRAVEATLISEHATAAEAFAEIDRLSTQMVRTGAPSNAIELIVVDAAGRIVSRPEVH